MRNKEREANRHLTAIVDDLRAEIERLKRERCAYREEVARLRHDVAVSDCERNDAMRCTEMYRARLAALEGRYNDLVMQVGEKTPGETRHETAKRYIVERELRGAEAGSTKAALGEGKP